MPWTEDSGEPYQQWLDRFRVAMDATRGRVRLARQNKLELLRRASAPGVVNWTEALEDLAMHCLRPPAPAEVQGMVSSLPESFAKARSIGFAMIPAAEPDASEGSVGQPETVCPAAGQPGPREPASEPASAAGAQVVRHHFDHCLGVELSIPEAQALWAELKPCLHTMDCAWVVEECEGTTDGLLDTSPRETLLDAIALHLTGHGWPHNGATEDVTTAFSEAMRQSITARWGATRVELIDEPDEQLEEPSDGDLAVPAPRGA